MTRILATLAAALVAACIFAPSQGGAEPVDAPQAAAGRPLNIVPLPRHAIRPVSHAIGTKAADASVGVRAPHRVVHPLIRRVAQHRQAAPAPVAFVAAQAPQNSSEPAVSRDTDITTTGPIGLLPWWHADPLETIHYLDSDAHSGVLAAADAWLGRPIAESHVAAIGTAVPRTSTGEVSDLDFEAEANAIDAGEFNAIDMMSVAVAGRRAPDQPWMQAWLAMLAGALAAAAAARYLFA